jgi:hypothetical protein
MLRERVDAVDAPGRRWRSDMGVEPTQDRITAPQTVLKLHCPVLRRLTGAVGVSETVQAEAVAM